MYCIRNTKVIHFMVESIITILQRMAASVVRKSFVPFECGFVGRTEAPSAIVRSTALFEGVLFDDVIT